MGKGLHQTINGLGTQKTKEYLKDAQSALLIKEMQINIIIKDFYVILAKKKKRSWVIASIGRDVGMVKLSPLVRVLNGATNWLMLLVCPQTQRNSAGHMPLPDDLGACVPKYLRAGRHRAALQRHPPWLWRRENGRHCTPGWAEPS